jgi:hypothetical protein
MKKYLKTFIVPILVICLFSCTSNKQENQEKKYPLIDSQWISWNLLFTPSSLTNSTNTIDDIEKYLEKYLKDRNKDTKITFHLKSCPCDTLLTNLSATVVYGSGGTISPPPTTPNPGPRGDYTLGNNLPMYIPAYLDSNKYGDSTKYFQITANLKASLAPKTKKIIAVIDTGLDTFLFRRTFPEVKWGGNLLWQDPASTNATLFNVVLGEPTNFLKDDNIPVKHGTAVTEIILSQMNKLQREGIPQVMIVRAFDSKEKGSIYTVSCAMSYAIQHHADYINASWGYFGKPDSVLRSYVQKASDSSIRIIAAAGNTPVNHDPGQVCNTRPNKLNSLDRLLKNDSLFYPACFAPDILNLVSVTQLNPSPSSPLDTVPCFYQNFSSIFITVGALDAQPQGNCCTFGIPFLAHPIEGSSFATPVMTARFMSARLGKDQDIKLWIKNNAKRKNGEIYTTSGSYFIFD